MELPPVANDKASYAGFMVAPEQVSVLIITENKTIDLFIDFTDMSGNFTSPSEIHIVTCRTKR